MRRPTIWTVEKGEHINLFRGVIIRNPLRVITKTRCGVVTHVDSSDSKDGLTEIRAPKESQKAEMARSGEERESLLCHKTKVTKHVYQLCVRIHAEGHQNHLAAWSPVYNVILTFAYLTLREGQKRRGREGDWKGMREGKNGRMWERDAPPKFCNM